MTRNTKQSKKLFLDAYVQNLNISESARLVGITRQCVLQWRNKDVNFLKAMTEAEEIVLDLAESNLYKLIEEKDFQAIKFILTCRRHGRWTPQDKMAVDLTSGGQPILSPVNITFEVVPPRDPKEILKEVENAGSSSDTAKV